MGHIDNHPLQILYSSVNQILFKIRPVESLAGYNQYNSVVMDAVDEDHCSGVLMAINGPPVAICGTHNGIVICR